MIRLTRFNGSVFILNCELIEMVEATPDTVISTIQGKKYTCLEPVDKVIQEIVEYKGKIQLISRLND